MGAVLLSPFYILLNLYLLTRILVWFSALSSVTGSLLFSIPFSIVYALVALTPLISVFGHGRTKKVTKKINNCWLGILMYLLIFLLAADLVRVIYCLAAQRSIFAPISAFACRTGGLIIFAAVTGVTVWGTFHGSRIRKTSCDVTVHKSCEIPSLKIALVADLHLGYNVGVRHIKKMAALIQAIHPDLIIFAGDIFDSEFDAVEHPAQSARILKSLESTFGSFACWGNHDIEEKIFAGFTFDTGDKSAASDPRMEQFLKDSGIRLLADETVLIHHAFYLCGRLDASCGQKSGLIRRTPSEITAVPNPGKPILVIDHQPSQLRELSEAGADLVLSGHTHDGQLFPGNLATRIGWMNSYGKLCLNHMTSIVTSGVGVWGPAMRVGTSNEVMEIQVRFAGETDIQTL